MTEKHFVEMQKAITKLWKNYDKALDCDFIQNPLAWALYQTWKEIDGREIPAVDVRDVDCVLKMFGECSYDETGCSDCLIKAKIKKALSADVRENVHGEWKHLGGDEWCCPSCGHVIHTEGSWEHPHERGALFCENCGADMRTEGKR